MIVVDTSALMAVLLGEPGGDQVAAAVADAATLHVSAATVAEALIVAGRRGIGAEMSELVDGLALTVDAPSLATARRVAEAYDVSGEGRHPTGLNVGDCFA